MQINKIIRPPVGADLSRPAPIYRPRWPVRNLDYFVNLYIYTSATLMIKVRLEGNVCTIQAATTTPMTMIQERKKCPHRGFSFS